MREQFVEELSIRIEVRFTHSQGNPALAWNTRGALRPRTIRGIFPRNNDAPQSGSTTNHLPHQSHLFWGIGMTEFGTSSVKLPPLTRWTSGGESLSVWRVAQGKVGHWSLLSKLKPCSGKEQVDAARLCLPDCTTRNKLRIYPIPRQALWPHRQLRRYYQAEQICSDWLWGSGNQPSNKLTATF